MRGRTTIGATFLLAGLLVTGRPARAELARMHDAPPGVRIWTNHGDVYRDGERMQVFFRTENDAYVTVLRVETSGLVRVLFPRSPGDPNLAHGGETYVVPGIDDQDAFEVDDAPGIGYVFAVASADPFQYDAFTASDRWSFDDINNLSDGRIHGDPYASLQDLVQHIMPAGYADYDTHLLPYYVNQHYDYPRFLCYDCHAYTPYASWDPYDAWCPRFSLFVYYNPFYFYPSYWYPTRYYRGTNVVYVRPGLTGSQYVFKTRTAESAPYVVYRDRRGTGGAAPAGGVRGVDVGGVGSIPSPGGRRTVGGGGAGGGGAASPTPVIGGGRRTVGGSIQGGGVARGMNAPADPAFRRYIAGPPAAASATPRASGPDVPAPSRSEVAPNDSRRGIYIDPGIRSSGTPAPRSAQPGPGTRYIPQQEAPRAAPGYAPRSAPATAAPPPRARPAPAAGRAPAPRSAAPATGRRGR